MNLGRDVFLALATIIWADGVVTKEESDALLGAARASGLAGADFEAIRRATEQRASVDGLAALSLQPDEKLYVYGIAEWLTRVDGVVTDDELAVLSRLGDVLALSEEDRSLAAAASFAMSSFGDVPQSVVALAKEIENAATAPNG